MDVYLPKVKGEYFFQIFSTDVQNVANWLSEYEMDSIELKIDNIINSSQTTKPILGSKRENGLTVVLKPKKTGTDCNCNNQALPEL